MIWTRIAVSIFYDDNHYTTGTLPLNYQPDLMVTSSQTKHASICFVDTKFICAGPFIAVTEKRNREKEMCQ